jgi:predicted transcriptional regulator
MTTITVEINKEQDLPALEAVLSKMGLKFHIEEDDDDWGEIPEAAIEGIKAGLADIEAGRTHTHEEVMAYMNQKYGHLKRKDG